MFKSSGPRPSALCQAEAKPVQYKEGVREGSRLTIVGPSGLIASNLLTGQRLFASIIHQCANGFEIIPR